MSHKTVFLALGAMLFAPCFSAQAQQPAKIPRIGYVTETGDFSSPSPNL
jgi:hypothetical protein